jgi:hypothetical protein
MALAANGAELAGPDAVLVAVGDAVGVVVEADHDALVVDAEVLVSRRAGRRLGREVDVAEVAVDVDPAEVGVLADAQVAVGSEPDGDA